MRRRTNGNRGVALVMALIITLVAFLVVATTLYLVTQSATMSGAGKTYATAKEAADGGPPIATDYIKRVQRGDDLLPIFNSDICEGHTHTIAHAIINEGLGQCRATLSLPGPAGTTYRAWISFQKLMATPPAGGRIVFGESGVGAEKSISQFYRIITHVENRATGATAENVTYYRYLAE